MARIAIFSDIHANIRALEASLGDLARMGGCERVYCLGDVIGYGPTPNAVLAVARQTFQLCIRGNHEHACIHGAVDFNEMARRAIDWTRYTVMPDYDNATPEQHSNWSWIANLPDQYNDGRHLFVHGAPQDPVDEYILPVDIDPQSRTYGAKLQEAFDLTPWLTFCGHSHYPGLFSQNGSYVSPTLQKQVSVTLDPNIKHIVNVGSVGQPRDGDNRSCYVIYDDQANSVTWRRIHYDIQDIYLRIYSID
ncbi:metallophosphoesterase family protein, partial [Planctomycetota bacterium]